MGILLAIVLASQGAGLEERLEAILPKLSADDYPVRQAASAELLTLPGEALGLVERALGRSGLDAETRWRLEAALPGLRAKVHKARSGKRKEERLALNRQRIVEAYRRWGRKDPKWDGAALEALDLVCGVWAKTPPTVPRPGLRAYQLATEAVRAGCDDPMVLYIRARMHQFGLRGDWNTTVELHLAAARRMKEAGGYDPTSQAFVFARAAACVAWSKEELEEADRAAALSWLDLGLERLEEAARDSGIPGEQILECADIQQEARMRIAGERKAGFEKVFAALEKGRPGGRVPLVFRGDFLVNYAWDARGGGYANSVTDEGWKLMRERLAEAEQVLTKAWELDPADPAAATAMLRVELGQNKGRDVMERWFRRAMEADPDNLTACQAKMYYLEPKWHGSAEEMLAFGRELLAGGNWEARLPLQLVEAHYALSGYLPEREAYYRNPAVWKDIRAVFEEDLRLHPDAHFDRSWYALLAWRCGQYVEAKRQFGILGDRLDPVAFPSREVMERARADAERLGR